MIQYTAGRATSSRFDMTPNTAESIRKKIGQEVGVSEWLQITQPMIDRFADLTDDRQFIHVDPRAAAQTPFQGTVAHGFLILAMIAKFVTEADFHMQGTAIVLNYGFDKIRMVSPVKTGSRIRGRFTLNSMAERSPGQWLSSMHIVIEIENESKPAVVADWLGLQFVEAGFAA
jgi:acyl dehydratase